MSVRSILPLLISLFLASTYGHTAQAIPVEVAPKAAAEGGERLCVAGHQTNLREKPSTDGTIIDKLDLGTTVMVRAVVPGGPVTLGGREDWWYQVAVLNRDGAAVGKGYMYGGTLTRACLFADIDGDGDGEHVSVAMNAQGAPLVRFLEVGSATQVTASLPITPAGSAVLSKAQVQLLPAHAAGFAMVRVEVFDDGPEARAVGRVFYVSYVAPRSGVNGTATLALQHPSAGEAGGSQWRTQMAFDPQSRTAVLTTVTTRPDGTQVERKQHYHASKGSYVEESRPR